ncbi:MAG: hypothetical protein M3081_12685 [Gemmatimonadota bacterium]|nr:hypothetical protein [Gemmatimonadota bacterium]
MSSHTAYWRRAHRDWRFRIGVVLMLVAMAVYIMTENLAFRPSTQRQASPTSRP